MAKRGKKKEKIVRITLVKSPIGYSERQKGTVRALGLRRMNQVVDFFPRRRVFLMRLTFTISTPNVSVVEITFPTDQRVRVLHNHSAFKLLFDPLADVGKTKTR